MLHIISIFPNLCCHFARYQEAVTSHNSDTLLISTYLVGGAYYNRRVSLARRQLAVSRI